METYDYILNGRIIPFIGHKQMETIKSFDIIDLMQMLKDEELSSSTIQKHYNVLSNIFKFAVKHNTIATNPIEKVDKPSVTYKKGDVYTTEEKNRLYHLLDSEVNQQMVLVIKLAFETGMRKGEILALQWDDVDLSKKIIHINHTLSYTKKHGYKLKSPKTEGSIRRVGIPEILLNDLKKHIFNKRQEKVATAELWDDKQGDYVFSTPGYDNENKLSLFGKPLFPDVPNKWWSRFLTRINKKLEADNKPILRQIRFHDTRHTFATDLISRGVNIYKVSKYLGHSSITTTVDTYGHLLEDDKEVLDMINERTN